MGGNMAQRLIRGGHRVHGFDPAQAARDELAGAGGVVVDSLQALVAALPAPRVLWMMRSEEHTSELQSLMRISYAVFCLTHITQLKSHHFVTTQTSLADS